MMESKFVYLFIFDFYISWICSNSFSIRYYIAEESKKDDFGRFQEFLFNC